MKLDLEKLEAMVANGATSAMILALIKIDISRYEASRASRRDMEAASKRRKRCGSARTSVELSGHDVDSGGHQVDTSGQPFDLFWKAYPKRSGANPRAPAEKVFLGFVKAGVGGVGGADIIAGAKAHAVAEPEKVGTQYIPQAVKWLRDRRWEDYLSSATSSATEINWDQVLTSYKQFGHWSRFAGPDPDSPACRAPPEMLEKYELRAQ